MGIWHNVNSVIEAEYNERTIRAVLKKGEELGFIYYDNDAQLTDKGYPRIGLEQAVNKVLVESRQKTDGGPNAYTNIGETICFLWFFRTENNNVKVSMGGFGVPKRKDFEYFYTIDYAFYMRLLLKICSDFTVLHVETETM